MKFITIFIEVHQSVCKVLMFILETGVRQTHSETDAYSLLTGFKKGAQFLLNHNNRMLNSYRKPFSSSLFFFLFWNCFH
jgi:hypothetical protein